MIILGDIRGKYSVVCFLGSKSHVRRDRMLVMFLLDLQHELSVKTPW